MVIFIAPSVFGDLFINEIVAANRFSRLDEDDDSSDWAEIYNSGPGEVDLDGYMLSDNPLILSKFILPSVTMGPGEYRLIWCSGKNRTLLDPQKIPIPDSPLPFMANLVTLSDTWRMLVGVPDPVAPPVDWETLSFVDSTWVTEETQKTKRFEDGGNALKEERTTSKFRNFSDAHNFELSIRSKSSEKLCRDLLHSF